MIIIHLLEAVLSKFQYLIDIRISIGIKYTMLLIINKYYLCNKKKKKITEKKKKIIRGGDENEN